MKVFNVHGEDWGTGGEREGYRWRARMIGPVRAVILTTKRAPAVAVYPASDKIGAWQASGEATDWIMLRRDAAVDYWDGE
jgi:hypothetical protein